MNTKKVAFLIHNDFQDDEFRQPYDALCQAGFEVTLLGPESDKTYRGKNLRERATSDLGLDAARPADYQALVIPGGYAPDKLRLVPGIAEFIRHFDQHKKPIAAICHGPQLLITADILRGRTVTCYESIAVDVKNAGANYVDEPVVVDSNLVTSRKPADLAPFCEATIALIKGEKYVPNSSVSTRS